MIALPATALDVLPAADPGGSSPDAASEIAASFAALLVGLQQQQALVAPQAGETPAAPPAIDSPKSKTSVAPEQLLPVMVAAGVPDRLDDSPAALTTSAVHDAISATSDLKSATGVPPPPVTGDSSSLTRSLRTREEVSLAAAEPLATISALPDRTPAPEHQSDLAAAPGTALPAIRSTPLPARQALAIIDRTPVLTTVYHQVATAQTAPVPPSPAGSGAPVKDTVAVTLAPPAESDPSGAAAPKSALSQAPTAATTPGAPPSPVATGPHDRATEVSSPESAVVAASTKSAIGPAGTLKNAPETGDTSDRPAKPPAPEQRALSAPVPQTPLPSDSAPAAATPEVKSADSASGIREAGAAHAESAPPTVTHLRVELAPPLLGEVVLELRHEREHIAATATVDRPATAEMLRMVQAQVQQVLADQGISVGSFEVSCRDGRHGGNNQAPAQQWQPERPEPPASAEPRRAATERRNSALVDLYA